MMKRNSISIRSYSREIKGHSHEFDQLVLPVKGVISIQVGDFNGKVRLGECVVIKSGVIHYFSAETEARFVVVDLETLPELIIQSAITVFSITKPLRHYLNFLEQQLKHQVNPKIEQLMYDTFYCLLESQHLLRQSDRRISNALAFIEDNLASPLTVAQLASIACLSPTQFKKIFKEQTGNSLLQYLIKLRMEKAQALLLHTDYPIAIIAENVGYADVSSFTRRFTDFFGMSPSKFSR